NPLEYAWAGGVTSAQFCEIDLNQDGILDLILFDRISNRLLFFVTNYEKDELKYVFSPQYFKYFPEINNWIICKDYDNDGKNDIFTYTRGGIKVYKNVSFDKQLKFKQVTDTFLKSYYNEIYSNILATNVDYPAIEDVDGDGDLDILVFGGLGAYVEYHKNHSMEKYGRPDSLLFYKESNCWGKFAESEESNIITLNTCPEESTSIIDHSKDPKHTGSTFLLFDADGDGLLDLLLGDVDYSSPCLLYNKGTSDEALITDYTFSYPENSPINLFSFPVMNYIDVDKDGKKELIVSPFDPSYYKIENTNSVWLYKNNGSVDAPNFILENKSFMQDKMINVGTGAYPVLFDYDNDGDLDLFVGNWGYCNECSHDEYMNLSCKYTSKIAFFENIGNNLEPKFILRTDDFASLSEYNLLGLYPAFIDFDNDGDYDLACGNSLGTVMLFENIGKDNFELLNPNWLGKCNPEITYSTPCLYDFNKDKHLDLVVGCEKGIVYYFENNGDNSFTKKSDFFGEIDVRDYNASWSGYSVPCVYNFNDTTYIFVGSESGQVFCYYDIDDNLYGTFKEKVLNQKNMGYRSAPAIANLNDNDFPEMIVGNLSGGLQFFIGVEPSAESIENHQTNNIKIYPNPGNDFIIIDAEKDYSLKIYDLLGKLLCTEKISIGINTISAEKLPTNSVYVLKFTNKNSMYSFKWIKK
ncbi:T9SS type A sorting domain-containing protein, partial [Bacteroidales bacterium OttesenSCG-928-K03]|nr:T9SS type A sorting domain-containing protein [Bacteroidales bacterium OttesenSCG-928-K03]